MPSHAPSPLPSHPASLLWDVFCQVVDNHGDLGVCWRLARDLAARGQRVRLWVDDASALAWMAPGGAPGVQVLPWRQAAPTGLVPGQVLIEAFGCDIAPGWVRAVSGEPAAPGHAWINLEYLSAEAYVERSHGLPSPVLAGPLAGRSKRFFYPGFTPATGGLLREPDLAQRQSRFDRAAWCRSHGLPATGERLVSLFCYEPAGLAGLLQALEAADPPSRLLVTPGRAAQAVRALRPDGMGRGRLSLHWLDALPQPGFDELLWACDLNFVRGEDSLVRALWAGQPLVWHIYPQHDGAHHAKLQAFLDGMQAPPSLRVAHQVWNADSPLPWPAMDLPGWREATQTLRRRLLAQEDLGTQLLGFVTKNQ